MSGAAEALSAAAVAALGALDGMSVFDAPPARAGVPYAVVDAGFETDWSHKSGIGREVRIAVTLTDEGERPVRLRRLAEAVVQALAAMGGVLPGWRIVTMRYVGTRTFGPGRGGNGGWSAVVEYRARMLAV